jgi:hypothetical protein
VFGNVDERPQKDCNLLVGDLNRADKLRELGWTIGYTLVSYRLLSQKEKECLESYLAPLLLIALSRTLKKIGRVAISGTVIAGLERR